MKIYEYYMIDINDVNIIMHWYYPLFCTVGSIVILFKPLMM